MRTAPKLTPKARKAKQTESTTQRTEDDYEERASWPRPSNASVDHGESPASSTFFEKEKTVPPKGSSLLLRCTWCLITHRENRMLAVFTY